MFQPIFYCVSTHFWGRFWALLHYAPGRGPNFYHENTKNRRFLVFCRFWPLFVKNTNAVSLFENRVFWSFLAIFDKIVIFHNFYHEKHRKNGGRFLHTFWVFDGFCRFCDFGTFCRFGRFWHFLQFWPILMILVKILCNFHDKNEPILTYFTLFFIKKEPQKWVETQ